jgi:uncharacterized membrane protein YeaQ/YmgE (transglycosylase-associated protein family)
MDVTSLVVGLLLSFLTIGALAGALASRSGRGAGLGLPGQIAVGIVGAFIGGFLFGLAPLPVEAGLVGAPIMAAIVAALALYLVGRITPIAARKARPGR